MRHSRGAFGHIPAPGIRANPNPTAFPSLGGTNALSRASFYPHHWSARWKRAPVTGGVLASLRAAQSASLVPPVTMVGRVQVVSSSPPFGSQRLFLAPRVRLVLRRSSRCFNFVQEVSIRNRDSRSTLPRWRSRFVRILSHTRSQKRKEVYPRTRLSSSPLLRVSSVFYSVTKALLHLPSPPTPFTLVLDRVPRFRLTVRFSGLRDSTRRLYPSFYPVRFSVICESPGSPSLFRALPCSTTEGGAESSCTLLESVRHVSYLKWCTGSSSPPSTLPPCRRIDRRGASRTWS